MHGREMDSTSLSASTRRRWTLQRAPADAFQDSAVTSFSAVSCTDNTGCSRPGVVSYRQSKAVGEAKTSLTDPRYLVELARERVWMWESGPNKAGECRLTPTPFSPTTLPSCRRPSTTIPRSNTRPETTMEVRSTAPRAAVEDQTYGDETTADVQQAPTGFRRRMHCPPLTKGKPVLAATERTVAARTQDESVPAARREADLVSDVRISSSERCSFSYSLSVRHRRKGEAGPEAQRLDVKTQTEGSSAPGAHQAAGLVAEEAARMAAFVRISSSEPRDAGTEPSCGSTRRPRISCSAPSASGSLSTPVRMLSPFSS